MTDYEQPGASTALTASWPRCGRSVAATGGVGGFGGDDEGRRRMPVVRCVKASRAVPVNDDGMGVWIINRMRTPTAERRVQAESARRTDGGNSRRERVPPSGVWKAIMNIAAAILILGSIAVGVLLAAGWIAIVRCAMPDEPRGIHRDDVDREFMRPYGPLVKAGHEAYRDRRDV